MFQGGARNDIYHYNFTSEIWTPLSPKGTMPARRRNHFTWMHSGLVFVFGGSSTGSVYSDMWSFDPYTLNWRQTIMNNVPQMFAFTLNYQMVYVPNDQTSGFKLYSFGGIYGSGTMQQGVYAYDSCIFNLMQYLIRGTLLVTPRYLYLLGRRYTMPNHGQ